MLQRLGDVGGGDHLAVPGLSHGTCGSPSPMTGIGFALPLGPPLGIARTILLLLA